MGSAAGLELDPGGEDDLEQDDQRKDKDWKIQRRKGFLKERESIFFKGNGIRWPLFLLFTSTIYSP